MKFFANILYCNDFNHNYWLFHIYIYIIKSSVKAYQPTLLFPIATNFEDHTVRSWIWRNVDKKQCVTQKPTRR